MKLVKVLKLLICFVLIVPLFATNASANSNYDHDELMQYEGYGKAMYDSIVEQTTFISGEYTDNKGYVRDSMNQVKEYADFWYNEYDDFTSSCYQNSFMNCLGEMTERGGAYVLTVGDWIKNLFTDYGEEYDEPVAEHPLSSFFTSDGTQININEGFYFTYLNSVRQAKSLKLVGGKEGQLSLYYQIQFDTFGRALLSEEIKFATTEERNTEAEKFNALNSSVNTVLGYASAYDLKVYNAKNELVVGNALPDRQVNPITKYINQNVKPEVVVPELKPRLVCPDGTNIQMSVSGSTFLAVDGTVMLVEKDGTAEVNGSLCNLNWDKPKVSYVDGESSITDSDGNWLDISDGTVNACLDPNGCKPVELDNSLLDYVKNAYNYATGVLKTGTDGLKSLAIGAKDLTALFGTFFGWLPNEMVVLMASGLGITVGLRLFRK